MMLSGLFLFSNYNHTPNYCLGLWLDSDCISVWCYCNKMMKVKRSVTGNHLRFWDKVCTKSLHFNHSFTYTSNLVSPILVEGWTLKALEDYFWKKRFYPQYMDPFMTIKWNLFKMTFVVTRHLLWQVTDIHSFPQVTEIESNTVC